MKKKEEANAFREKCRAAAKKKFDSQKPLWKKAEDMVNILHSSSLHAPECTVRSQQGESDKITDELTALKDRDKKRKNAIQSLKNDIHKMEHELAHPPEIEDMETITRDLVRTN